MNLIQLLKFRSGGNVYFEMFAICFRNISKVCYFCKVSETFLRFLCVLQRFTEMFLQRFNEMFSNVTCYVSSHVSANKTTFIFSMMGLNR